MLKRFEYHLMDESIQGLNLPHIDNYLTYFNWFLSSSDRCLVQISYVNECLFLRWCPFWERGTISNRPRPHAREIWKLNLHRLFSICFWGKLGQKNHTQFFFFLGTKTQGQRFQIRPVWRAFSKSPVFVTRKNKKAFSNFYRCRVDGTLIFSVAVDHSLNAFDADVTADTGKIFLNSTSTL